MTWVPDMVIYHAPCDDGFGAALMAFRKWGIGLEWVPAGYGDEPPNVEGKNVLILDFSYKADVLALMGETAASIVVLDHHVSAQTELEEFIVNGPLNINNLGDAMSAYVADGPCPIIMAIFDMDRSGAGMAADFLFPDEPRPVMIDYLEDRDLWRFKNPNTRPFTMYLRSVEFNFLEWCAILDQMEDPAHSTAIIARGQSIEAFFNRKIEEVAGEAFVTEIGGFLVPTVNANWTFSSDVCHRLLDMHPNARFVASFFIRKDGKVQFSLRSRSDREDVSAVAAIYDGGGHRNAAGFTARDEFSFAGRLDTAEFLTDGQVRLAEDEEPVDDEEVPE